MICSSFSRQKPSLYSRTTATSGMSRSTSSQGSVTRRASCSTAAAPHSASSSTRLSPWLWWCAASPHNCIRSCFSFAMSIDLRTRTGQIGILMYPDFGQLFLHLTAVLADDVFIREVLVASQHAQCGRFVEALHAFQHHDRVELAARIAGTSHRSDHHFANECCIELAVFAVQIVCRHAVQPLDAVPVRLGSRKHIDNGIEAVLHCERDHGVARVP